ncbi:hypothetical protein ALC53_12986, partial [Atta colombica]
ERERQRERDRQTKAKYRSKRSRQREEKEGGDINLLIWDKPRQRTRQTRYSTGKSCILRNHRKSDFKFFTRIISKFEIRIKNYVSLKKLEREIKFRKKMNLRNISRSPAENLKTLNIRLGSKKEVWWRMSNK